MRIAHLVGMIIFVVCMLFIWLIFFEIIWVSTALLMWWFTIAIWFAMDTTIGNMVAWVMLLTNKKIQVGKSFKFLGDINEIARIEEFHIRYTVLRNIHKQRIIVPNSVLLNTPIQTKKTEELARWELHINLSRRYDLSVVRDTIIGAINAHEKVLHKDQTTVIIKSFTPKGYELVCYYYYSPLIGKKVDFFINGELRSAIKYALERRGMKLTYNRQVIRIDPELF
jgi:small-conductance mechanosensitive channel